MDPLELKIYRASRAFSPLYDLNTHDATRLLELVTDLYARVRALEPAHVPPPTWSLDEIIERVQRELDELKVERKGPGYYF